MTALTVQTLRVCKYIRGNLLPPVTGTVHQRTIAGTKINDIFMPRDFIYRYL